MGQPAARSTDLHICPKQTPTTPPVTHGPGQVMASGASRVFVNKLPAAVQNDMCICVLEPGNTINQGSATVNFGGQPAARQGDGTSHMPGGMIQQGSPNVFIG